MNNDYKKWNERIGQMLDKNYDVECVGCMDDVIISPNFVNSTKDIIMSYKRYRNIKLIHMVNFFEQFYFKTEDGSILILPGRYIISIFPAQNKEK